MAPIAGRFVWLDRWLPVRPFVLFLATAGIAAADEYNRGPCERMQGFNTCEANPPPVCPAVSTQRFGFVAKMGSAFHAVHCACEPTKAVLTNAAGNCFPGTETTVPVLFEYPDPSQVCRSTENWCSGYFQCKRELCGDGTQQDAVNDVPSAERGFCCGRGDCAGKTAGASCVEQGAAGHTCSGSCKVEAYPGGVTVPTGQVATVAVDNLCGITGHRITHDLLCNVSGGSTLSSLHGFPEKPSPTGFTDLLSSTTRSVLTG